MTKSDVPMLWAAIQRYAQACVADSWKGGGDPADIPDIEDELSNAQCALEDIVHYCATGCTIGDPIGNDTCSGA